MRNLDSARFSRSGGMKEIDFGTIPTHSVAKFCFWSKVRS